MYNAERYIGACLQSILGQTFQNYEVIVVDDCSNDNSVEVVNSYVPRFGGRLRLSQLEINSGSPAAPENKGVALANGKYIFVMDNDDLIVNVALEILYRYAEIANADVVYTCRRFDFATDTEKPFPSSENLRPHNSTINTNVPVLINGNMPNRLQQVCGCVYYWPAWTKFVRREFLMENNINFLNLESSSDVGWTVQIICRAERLLCIPNPLYIYRVNPKSLYHSHSQRSANELVDYWAEMFVNGIKYFEDWTSKQKFFAENPQYKFMIFDLIARDYLANMRHTITTISVTEYQKLLESKLKRKLGEDSAITAHLMASSTLLRLQCEGLIRRLFEAENRLRALRSEQAKENI